MQWELRKIGDTVTDSMKTEEVEPADANIYDVYGVNRDEQGRI